MITRRNPRHLVGWLLLVNALLGGLQNLSDYYGIYGLRTRPGMPWAAEVAWFQEWLWVPMFGITIGWIPLLFPGGQLLSPGWRPVAAATALATGIASAALALRPGPYGKFPHVQNVFAAGSDPQPFEFVFAVALVALTATAVLATSSLMIRFRRGSVDERQQVKWVLAAEVLAVIAICLGGTKNPVLETVTVAGLFAVPLAIGLAVLNYRLYDLDIVIQRSLVYVPLTAILAGAYIAGIGVFKGVFEQLAGVGSDGAVALTTLLVVALLTPVKNAIQGFVDAKFKAQLAPLAVLRDFEGRVRTVVEVLSPVHLAARLAEDLGRALPVDAVAVYLGSSRKHGYSPAATLGAWHLGGGEILPLVTASGVEAGEVYMVLDRGRPALAPAQRQALEHCLSAVAETLLVLNQVEAAGAPATSFKSGAR